MNTTRNAFNFKDYCSMVTFVTSAAFVSIACPALYVLIAFAVGFVSVGAAAYLAVRE